MENQWQINWDENGNHGQEAHPPPEQLMLYVDGELAPEEAARTESHLEACWVCRTRTVKIEAAITDFIEYHQMALTPRLTPPAGAWRRFDARLDRRAEEVGRPSWLSRLGARLGGGLRELFSVRVTPMRLAFCMAVVVVAVVSFRLFRSPVVSASELLQRTMRAETARLSQVAEPVVYPKLQVRRPA